MRLVDSIRSAAPGLVLLLALEIVKSIDGKEQVESRVVGGAVGSFSRCLDGGLSDGRSGLDESSNRVSRRRAGGRRGDEGRGPVADGGEGDHLVRMQRSGWGALGKRWVVW